MDTRAARVRAFAKINLDLRVLHKRPDNYHELRTIFQTISLADNLTIECTPSPTTSIDLKSAVDIPDNLVVRAARAVLDVAERTAALAIWLDKRIPMGGGLGGGSTDAAAVLLALPALLGVSLPFEQLMHLASELGSDVPFFLLGGTALGLGRGTELYPLPDVPPHPGLVVAPAVHVSTPEAYRALGRELTFPASSSTLSSFEGLAWSVCAGWSVQGRAQFQNDFEAAVFQQHPLLKSLKAELGRTGAQPAMMTGSGAALFGLYGSVSERDRAAVQLEGHKVFKIRLLNRQGYRRSWWKALHSQMDNQVWPPQSRSAQ